VANSERLAISTLGSFCALPSHNAENAEPLFSSPQRIVSCVALGMRHDNLRDRTFNYAVATIKSVRPLIDDPLGRHLVGQPIRSSAAVASNYRSACHARSRRDFASKISIVAEEAAETSVWLRLFVALELLADSVAQPLVGEGEELTAIAVASAITARRSAKLEVRTRK